MRKSILINQPRGLGDIFFCQKIAHILTEHNFDVFWYTPVYFWLNDYNKNQNIKYVNKNLQTDFILNLENSIESNHPDDLMTCKYEMIGKTLNHLPSEIHSIDYSDWDSYMIFNRNFTKEDDLFYNVLGIADNEEYTLCNVNYGINQKIMNPMNNLDEESIKLINLDVIDGFTLLDWCKVVENAKYINTVDTSIIFIIESIHTNCKKLNMFPRHEEHTFKALKNVLHKNWIWK